jgi:hypothetical protein
MLNFLGIYKNSGIREKILDFQEFSAFRKYQDLEIFRPKEFRNFSSFYFL